jgi:hypothetical protein
MLGSKPLFDCELDVKARRILGTIPISWSFAMRTLPPGVSVRIPAELGDLIATTARHPIDGDPKKLEKLLAKVLSDEPASPRAKAALHTSARADVGQKTQ